MDRSYTANRTLSGSRPKRLRKPTSAEVVECIASLRRQRMPGKERECQINCVRWFHGEWSSADCSRQTLGKEDDELGVSGAPFDGGLPVNAEIPQRQIE